MVILVQPCTFGVNIHFFLGRVISLNVAVFLAGGAAVVVAQVLSAGADVTDDLERLVTYCRMYFIFGIFPSNAKFSGWLLGKQNGSQHHPVRHTLGGAAPSSVSCAHNYPSTL